MKKKLVFRESSLLQGEYIPLCIEADFGLCGSMQVMQLPKSQMNATAICWKAVQPDYLLHLIYPPKWDMILMIL